MSVTAVGNEQESTSRKLYPKTRVHTPLPSPAAMTEAHLEQYRKLGFVAIENVFSAKELDDAKAAISRLVRGDNPEYTGVQIEDSHVDKNIPPDERELYVRKLMGFVNFDERLKALAEQPTMLSIVRRFVGSDVVLAQDMALLKPPHFGTEKPWHQDTAYFLFDPPDGVIGTWTALDESTVDNGCMYIVPGSHLLGAQAHFHDRDCQIPDDRIDVDRVLAVPLNPGGVLFFHGLMHHGTPPNCSPSRRRALQFHYASVNCKKMDIQRHADLFHDGNAYAGCAVWSDPTGRMKMRKISERT